jgi:tetratricopeptide (TPR) repeat protein
MIDKHKQKQPHRPPASKPFAKVSGKKPSLRPGDRNTWLYALIVLFITFIFFSPSLKNGFTNWDDDLYVTENIMVKNPDGVRLNDFLSTNVAGNFHPLTMLTFAAEYALVGEKPFLYHLTNILFHLANTLLVFLLAYRLAQKKRFVALFTALVFGIHPMHVESVTWISERKDVLYTFFFLLSTLLYLDYQKKRSWLRYAGIFILFFLSCLSKSAAVVLPVVFVLLDWYNKRISWRSVLNLLPFFIISVLVGIKAINTQAESRALGDIEYFSLFEKIRFASYGFTTYLVKFFVPFKMASFHPYPKDAIPVFYNISVLIVVALFALAIFIYKRDRTLLFGLLFYLITVALVLQFITVGNAVIAERYTYVPYIGVAFVVGVYLSRLQASGFKLTADRRPPTLRASPSGHAADRFLLYTIVITYLFTMGILTFQRTKVWKDPETLWTDVIAKYPNEDGAYVNRGQYLRTRNNYDGAFTDYMNALSINPENALAYHNRGKIYFDRGEVELAMADFNRSIELKPDNAEAFSNRGAAFGMKKEYEKALADLNRSVELDPSRKASFMNRAVLNYETKRYDDAIADINQFLKFEPGDADMINLRGLCHRLAERLPEAIADYTLAIRLKPQEPTFYLNRSYAYQYTGETEKAIDDASRAQELGGQVDPGYLRLLKSE